MILKPETVGFVRGGMLFLEPPQKWRSWQRDVWSCCANNERWSIERLEAELAMALRPRAAQWNTPLPPRAAKARPMTDSEIPWQQIEAERRFKVWIVELRNEIDQVYSRFDLMPAHWRDDFDKGRTPAEALDRIMQGAADFKARKARH